MDYFNNAVICDLIEKVGLYSVKTFPVGGIIYEHNI